MTNWSGQYNGNPSSMLTMSGPSTKQGECTPESRYPAAVTAYSKDSEAYLYAFVVFQVALDQCHQSVSWVRGGAATYLDTRGGSAAAHRLHQYQHLADAAPAPVCRGERLEGCAALRSAPITAAPHTKVRGP